MSSDTMYTSFHSFLLPGGGKISTSERTLTCCRCLSILISRNNRLQSVSTSKARGIFLMATLCPFLRLQAEHTSPLAPCPTARVSSYSGVTSNLRPQMLYRFVPASVLSNSRGSCCCPRLAVGAALPDGAPGCLATFEGGVGSSPIGRLPLKLAHPPPLTTSLALTSSLASALAILRLPLGARCDVQAPSTARSTDELTRWPGPSAD
mmetsp:Transcript_32049/g.79838  ORF Transcript_32049/g.79838 Transcript_32049/m.79838 type:complete len:207 (-) Transcript_32049:57-677(-)